ncbi:MAG: GNAT family N-acetyltransferase [Caldimonas sp.]
MASLSVAEREQSWVANLAAGASRTLVAKQGGHALGFISFGHCRDEGAGGHMGEVWALYVSPRTWSSGVGWALWEAARVLMLHQGFSEVSLWVLSGNVRGLRFYESIGFRLESHSEKFFERGGAKLAEVRLVFSGMSASPSIERTSHSQPRCLRAATHVKR